MSKQNKKNIFYDNRYIFLSFGISAAIMLIVYICYQLFPFGDSTVLRMDLYHQYAPLFSELYDKITTGGSLAYSWETGLGSSFLGNYFNYLSSPIGFIVMMIAGHKNVPEAIATMILIKAALSSAALSYYFKKSFKISNYITVAFSVLYSFCGWFVAYYWNVMWVDAMVFLPIIALGIEMIINKQKPWLYITALCLTLFSNYYMSFMMCIFSCLYFLCYYAAHYSLAEKIPTNHLKKSKKFMKSRFLKSGFIFAFSSILAAGLLAFALLPTFNTLQQTSATGGTFPSDGKLYFTLFDFLSNQLASLQPTIRSSGDTVLPNIYSGTITIMLLPLFFMTKSIKLKEKITDLILLALFFIGFNFNMFNYIWHGNHYPNDLPYRQSFMFCFLLIIIAFKTFIRLKEIPNRFIYLSAFGVCSLAILAEKLESKNITSVSVFITLAFCVVYAVILIQLKDKKSHTVSVSVLLLCCICSEIIIGNTGSYSMDQLKTNYVGDYDAFKVVKTYIDENDDDEFYRMELSKLRTRMDNAWYGYNGVSTFSSMAYKNVSSLQKDLGMYGNDINSYTYNPQTMVYNALFGLKYLVNNDSESDSFASSDYLTKLTSYDKFTVYQNKTYLPLGYVCENTIDDFESVSGNPFDVQNILFDKMTGTEDVLINFMPYDIAYSNIKPFSVAPDSQLFNYTKVTNDEAGSVTYYFKAEDTSEIYLYVKTDEEKEGIMTVKCGEDTISQTLNRNYPCILNTGKHKKGQVISVTVPLTENSGQITVYGAYLNNKAFVAGFTKLYVSSLKYEEVTDTLVKGTVNCLKDGTFTTTIPYDKGWSVYVDGEKLNEDDIYSVADALLCFKLSKGEHEIEMKYTPDGLVEGLEISFVFLLILAVCLIIKLIREKKNKPVKDISYTENIFLNDINSEGIYTSVENEKISEIVPILITPDIKKQEEQQTEPDNSEDIPFEPELEKPSADEEVNPDFHLQINADLGEAEFEKFLSDDNGGKNRRDISDDDISALFGEDKKGSKKE